MAVLGPHCCGQAFSNWEERGLLSGCRAPASHCSGFSWWRAQALGARASIAGANGLSRHAACGILPDQGSSLCLLHRRWILNHWTTGEAVNFILDRKASGL